MQRTIVQIKGMHCRSCELLIEENLKNIEGVKRVDVSYRKKKAIIFANYKISDEKIREAVEEAGYGIGSDEKKLWFTRDEITHKNVFDGFLAFIIIYWIASYFGIFDGLALGQSGGNSSDLLLVLLVGITAGFSTCMALVGGLVLSLSARHAERHPEATVGQKFRPHLFFNLGRVLSYFLLGGVIGLLGNAFEFSSLSLGILTILVGIVMFIMGIQLTEISPKIASFSFSLPASLGKLLGIRKHHDKEYSHSNAMIGGALTFFLPCGFTQAMQLLAMSTGNFWQGALIMGTFAIGTMPGLLGVGGLTSVVKGGFAKKFFAFTGILVLFFSYFNISNGLTLTGWELPSFSLSQNNVSETNVVLEDGVQIARMDQLAGGYSPNRFVVQKGVPVKWLIDGKETRSCASFLVLPKLGIRKSLKLGENVIEFTPSNVGELRFSCSMGMYSGRFVVVDESSAKKSI